mmetsp:Transcript_20069/g.43792  ORF Transcript_20069/g.43792 Transcript_20069/m.43792 type:complete len:252 (-) Transcript_20069:209-964(-)
MAPKLKKKIKKTKRTSDRNSSDAEDALEETKPAPAAPAPTKGAKAAKADKAAKKAKVAPAAKEDAKADGAAKKAKVAPAAKEDAKPKAETKAAPISLDKPSKGEVARLTEEAIAAILENIQKPECQKDGKAFIPDDWGSKYKNALGKYRKFLERHPDKFTVCDTGAFDYVVKVATEGAVPQRWQKELVKAWRLYCEATKESSRDIDEFIKAIPGKIPRKGSSAGDSPAEAKPEGGKKKVKKEGKVLKKKKA